MSIRIENLSKKIGKRLILDSINLEVASGEVVGFLGANGAGKTTTLRIVAGALDYSEGSVQVCGMDVNENRLTTASKIGYLPENNALYEDMYMREYLLFVAAVRKLGKDAAEQVEAIIKRVRLENEAHKRISELSKGCRQRVGIAQALLSDPDVLILDEPTSGLDPIQMDEIHKLVEEVGQNKTVLFSSHNLQEVERLCKRVVIINAGKIVATLNMNENTRPLEELFREYTVKKES